MARHEMHDIAAGAAQDHRALQVDVEHERRFEQQREGAAEPLRLRLLDIVENRPRSGSNLCPVPALAQPEKLMRRNNDPQIEPLIAIGILVALHRIDTLGLESPGQEIGDLAHKEIAERAAKDANLDAATSQRRRALGHISVGRRAFGEPRQAVPLGPYRVIHLRQQARHDQRAGKGAPLLQPVPQKMPPGLRRVARDVGM